MDIFVKHLFALNAHKCKLVEGGGYFTVDAGGDKYIFFGELFSNDRIQVNIFENQFLFMIY